MRPVAFVLALTAGLSSASAVAQAGLGGVERWVDWQHTVESLPVAELQAGLRTDTAEQHLLFDVRESDEFAVSRLPGAVRVPPQISSEAFIRQYGDALDGRRVVFYCSVGRRSGALADRLMPELQRGGASDVRNLRGGIFRWAGEGLPMENAAGKTDRVHPYSKAWARVLPSSAQPAYVPDPD